MANPFQSLLAAIFDDDCAKVKALLAADSELAKRGVAGADRLEMKIAHYIYTGDTALHAAAAGYRVEIAKLLLEAGAEVAAAGNRRGSQPLHYVADGHLDSPAWNPSRQVATIRLLLKAGANINAQDKNGVTPIHRAVRTRCAAVVKCLLDAGTIRQSGNKPGSTPFHLAAQNTGRGGSGAEKARVAQREILHAFLTKGVSPNLKDAKGKSVQEWAQSEEISEILSGKVG